HGPARESDESAVDGRDHRRAGESWWKNLRENGLMRDQQVLPDPLFSPTARTAVGTYDGAIDTPQLLVHLACIDDRPLQSVQNPAQRPICIPSVEQTVNRFPRTKILFGQVAPRRTRSQDPQNAIHYLPPIRRWTAGLRRRRKEIGDQSPLF